MGYRIEYGENGTAAYFVKKEGGHRGMLTIGFFLLFCVLTSTLWPSRWQLAKDYLIPGDPAVTKAAFSEMTQQLKDGESLEDAVVTFCREVMDGPSD